MNEVIVHIGTYGCADSKERLIGANRGTQAGKPWHQSLSHEQVTKLFVAWGIVGRCRAINPVVRLMPYFDRGPGWSEKANG